MHKALRILEKSYIILPQPLYKICSPQAAGDSSQLGLVQGNSPEALLGKNLSVTPWGSLVSLHTFPLIVPSVCPSVHWKKEERREMSEDSEEWTWRTDLKAQLHLYFYFSPSGPGVRPRGVPQMVPAPLFTLLHLLHHLIANFITELHL